MFMILGGQVETICKASSRCFHLNYLIESQTRFSHIEFSNIVLCWFLTSPINWWCLESGKYGKYSSDFWLDGLVEYYHQFGFLFWLKFLWSCYLIFFIAAERLFKMRW